ncbi:uncharacterized protein LOC143612556 [Bidens hawaiensis]|uniref:uncharacterized protein LOC143612556 n=1 Tax=Bidens hawaiensis TaxID=980011 RepID=UPI00404B821A
MRFLNLKAGKMTHREYTTEFNGMSILMPEMVNTEAKRIKCYVRGLPQNVRTLVKANRPATFDSTVELAQMVYDDLEVNYVVVEEKKEKKWVTHTKRPGTQMWNPKDKKQKVWEREIVCGKPHRVECRFGSNACFKCGKVGHYAHECKAKPTCYKCWKTGHMARECTEGEAGGSGKRDAEKNRPKT